MLCIYVCNTSHMYIPCALFRWYWSALHNEAKIRWPPFRRRHFQTHFLEWNVCISINISLKFIPKGPIDNKPLLVQIMAWCRKGDKPSSEPSSEPMVVYGAWKCCNSPVVFTALPPKPPSLCKAIQWVRLSIPWLEATQNFTIRNLIGY